MKWIAPFVAATTLAATAALAQTTAPSQEPSRTVPPAASPAPAVAPTVTPSATTAAAPTMTDEQAKTWVNKKVYSSDDKNMGEVAAFQRDSSGKVSELHADIGGFLGIGETRVRVPADKIKLEADRVVVQMTSDQMKSLPKLAK